MKITTFILFAMIAQVSANGFAQKITLSQRDITLKEIFRHIRKQTGYNISYSNQVINDAKKIDVKFNEVPLESVLQKILNDNSLVFKINEKDITIKRITLRTPTQQEETFVLKGSVFDTSEPPSPLSSVTVTIKRTNQKTITDVDGTFQVRVLKTDTLIFSITGYTTRILAVPSGRTTLNISMQEDVAALDQVVVTGIGSQQVKNIASSVAVVNMGNVTNKPITQLSQALQGGATGIQVTQSSGLPGGDAAAIKIRGIASNLGSSPLVLVDGVPYDIDKLDPNTIESVSILKDAAAAAIYGARAGNGVIVITTKRGKADVIELGYNSFFGVQQPTVGHPEFVDASKFMEMVNLAQTNIGSTPSYSQEVIESTRQGLDPVHFPNTNWYNSVIKKWTPMQQHSLSVSGGNSAARFALTSTYLKQDNMVSVGGFDRAIIRGNTSVNLSKNVVTFLDFSVSRENKMEPHVWGYGTGQLLSWIYTAPPNIPVKYPNKETRPNYTYYGNYGESWNPVANIEKGGERNTIKDDILLNLRPKWTVLPGLSVKGQFSYRVSSGVSRATRDQYLFFDYFTDQKIGRDFETVREANTAERANYYYIGGSVDYNKTFGKHNVNAIALYSQEYDNWNKWDVKTLLSYLGKVYYSFDDKYLLELGLRRDGSSLFAEGKRWGYFPSVAVGWNIMNEDFFKSINFINMFKIRSSYGTLGNNNIKPYAYQTTIDPSGMEQVFGNPDITWEKMNIFNTGADISLLNSKVDVTIDVYNKITTDLILVPIPTLTSSRGETPTNIGSLRNRGAEVKIGYNTAFGKDFKINTSLGYSYNRTKIIKQATNIPIIGNGTRRIEGGPFNEWWGYKSGGLLTEADIANNVPIMSGQEVGDIKYIDVNKDGKITSDDWTSLGNPDALANYFANVAINYKRFDFEMQVNGMGKNVKFYWDRLAYPLDIGGNGGTPLVEQTDYWTPENLDAKYPRLRPTAGTNGEFSDFWSVNGAFTRIRYMQLGYTLPSTITKRWSKSLRVYVNAQNPFVFSDMKIVDPESAGGASSYSIMKTFTFGLNVNL
ncbi:SusC/RagA family TonB-linked outer membrane protein [Pedobacter nyackensis]|uniref:SusC/RagA family TonB-linked outer membrane protein n=1 Tax=Pedobacter nyackensis TaxID=475255 RepID=UPI00292EDAD1|nr:SusC/RagA family TonB-linked outer membrane protein [Pedobacter nyackensis]